MNYFDSTYNDFIYPLDKDEVQGIIRERTGYMDCVDEGEMRAEMERIIEENRDPFKRAENRRVQDILGENRGIRDGSSHWDSYSDSHYHDSHHDTYDDYGDQSYYHDEYRDGVAVPRSKKPRNRRVQDILGENRRVRDGSSHWDSYNDSHYHDNYHDTYDDYGDQSYYHDEYRDGCSIDSPKTFKKVPKKVSE